MLILGNDKLDSIKNNFISAEGVIQVIALQLIYGELGLYLTSNNRSYCSGSTVIKTDVIQKKSDLINLVLSSLMANGFFVEISQVK